MLLGIHENKTTWNIKILFMNSLFFWRFYSENEIWWEALLKDVNKSSLKSFGLKRKNPEEKNLIICFLVLLWVYNLRNVNTWLFLSRTLVLAAADVWSSLKVEKTFSDLIKINIYSIYSSISSSTRV